MHVGKLQLYNQIHQSSGEADNRRLLQNAPLSSTAIAIIDLDALQSNYRFLKSLAATSETAAVVKANAYGLGIEEIVSALYQEGCKSFFVATLDEAKRVRQKLAHVTIYVLDGLLPGTAPIFALLDLRPVLGNIVEMQEWALFNRQKNTRRAAALHVDTGMTRLGLDQVDFRNQPSELIQQCGIELLISHLACGDQSSHPKNAEQLENFSRAIVPYPQLKRSLANSAGIFLGSNYHLNMTRPGIALYGGKATDSKAQTTQPVISIYGRVLQLRFAERGETVGYNASYTLKKRTKIATIALGYADGFFRGYSSSDQREGPPARVGDHILPLLGRVSMDLITYDATNIPANLLARGDFVEIIGEKFTVDDLAAFSNTIGYEVLTSIGSRFHRIYKHRTERH